MSYRLVVVVVVVGSVVAYVAHGRLMFGVLSPYGY